MPQSENMHTEKPIFCQVMEWVHGEQFRRCVNRYEGNYRVRNFSCWDQFLVMSFAQLTYRDSLADIEICLRSRQDQLYRPGFRSAIAHSTLADANSSRDWRIYHALAQGLIARARRLYADEPFGVELEQTVYALDSTTLNVEFLARYFLEALIVLSGDVVPSLDRLQTGHVKEGGGLECVEHLLRRGVSRQRAHETKQAHACHFCLGMEHHQEIGRNAAE